MAKNILITTQRVDTKDPILQFFLDWIREFAKHYDTVYVVCLEEGEYTLPENVVVRSLGKEGGAGRLGYIRNFYKHVIPLIRNGEIEKIFVHMNEIYVFLLMPLWFLRRSRGISLVWWKTQAKLSFFAKIMRFFVDVVFTASEHGFKVTTAKKVITGHGINTQYFVPRTTARTSDTVSIIAVGRAIPVKHYEDCIAAIALLKEKIRNFSLTIIGVRPEDQNEYVRELEAQIREHELTEYVKLMPPVPFSQMVHTYHDADVILNTTYPNTFDKVLLEAMACGVIPVTPTPSYESILAPHNLFPRDRSAEAIADVLFRICSMEQGTRALLGSTMRTEIVEHHNVEKLIKRIADYTPV